MVGTYVEGVALAYRSRDDARARWSDLTVHENSKTGSSEIH